MSTTDDVKILLLQHAFSNALVIDDGFDKEPDYEEFEVDQGAGLGDMIENLAAPLKARLAAVLVSEDLDGDDWEAGLDKSSFLAELWTMRSEGLLPDVLDKALFGVYDTNVGQKKKELDPLLTCLKEEFSLEVTTVGREQNDLPNGINVVFLDLFLGIKEGASAREEAIERIKGMLDKIKDEDRPVVVLMSSKASELEKWADDLRERAGLMGAKFRVIGKPEFSREGAIAEILQELLAPLNDANTVARLIDTWDSAIEKVRSQIRNDLRRLDLADYGYLKRYRLDAEGMPLGSYLLEAYGDVLKYELEACTELRDVSAHVDQLSFDQSAYPHFLPDTGVSFLNHAMTFVHQKAIDKMGEQMEAAATNLRLGDLVVKDSDAKTLLATPLTAQSIPIHVVISPACDLQQGKSDVVLLLSGTISPRDWDEAFNLEEHRIDCFMWKNREYSIDWQRANLNAWRRDLATRRLKVGGDYRRIARLRDLPAMKAQHLFASNLTRVGTLAAPHAVNPVGLKIEYKDKGGTAQTLFETAADDSMACLLKGFISQGKSGKGVDYLVFHKSFAKRLGEEVKKVLDKLPDEVREDAKAFVCSPVALSRLRQPCEAKKLVEYKKFRIEVRSKPAEKLSHSITISAQPGVSGPA